MTGAHEVKAVLRPDPDGSDDAVSVDWDVPTRQRLEDLGAGAPVSGGVDVVVLDRRGAETTPTEPGELTVGGRRVVVVPDRGGAGPPVEVWVVGDRERYEGVVDVLRRTVDLDASVDAAFDDAGRRNPREGADGGPTGRAIERTVLAFEVADTPLAVGGFAAAIEPLG